MMGGKVLVHCGEGISRSATIVLAYLMIKCGFTAQESVKQVRRYRSILPNVGFLKQICDLNDQLIQQKGGDKSLKLITKKDLIVS